MSSCVDLLGMRARDGPVDKILPIVGTNEKTIKI